MGKFKAQYDQCEELYVIQGKTLAQIQIETEVSQPTLSKWKTNGEWDKKRGESLIDRQSLSELLEEITLKLAKNIVKDLKEGGFDSQKVFALNQAIKAKSTNTTAERPMDSKEEKEGGVSKSVADIFRDVLRGGVKSAEA